MSRYLLRRGMFTGRVVIPFAEIEAIVGNNLPITATRDEEWWKNSRFSAQGRAWMDVGWNVESVDMNNHAVTLIRVTKPETKQRKRTKEKKQTEFFKRPPGYRRHKKPALPSKSRIAKAQARLRNVERQRASSQAYGTRVPTKSAYEKRLFKPGAKPSTAPD